MKVDTKASDLKTASTPLGSTKRQGLKSIAISPMEFISRQNCSCLSVCWLLLVGLWDSRVLSGSSLSVFAAHWKRLLHHLDSEMRAFELLPLERLSKLPQRVGG